MLDIFVILADLVGQVLDNTGDLFDGVGDSLGDMDSSLGDTLNSGSDSMVQPHFGGENPLPSIPDPSSTSVGKTPNFG